MKCWLIMKYLCWVSLLLKTFNFDVMFFAVFSFLHEGGWVADVIESERLLGCRRTRWGEGGGGLKYVGERGWWVGAKSNNEKTDTQTKTPFSAFSSTPGQSGFDLYLSVVYTNFPFELNMSLKGVKTESEDHPIDRSHIQFTSNVSETTHKLTINDFIEFFKHLHHCI